MDFTEQEVRQYVEQEDVRFIRLAFCDVFGKQKNIAILPTELDRAFRHGIAIDASAIAGFGGEVRSDLFLHPDPATLASLPWRGENGQVVRMFCGVAHPDGTTLKTDSRALLPLSRQPFIPCPVSLRRCRRVPADAGRARPRCRKPLRRRGFCHP